MSHMKRDLEIVYSLQWKRGLKREDKQMSIVAVYDIPATTLSFEVFKSYLLKNSGTAEDDVNVFYVMDNGREYPIQTQTDFQVALYAFRRKARAGDVINLLLEKISDRPVRKNPRHSNDVETQFDSMGQPAVSASPSNEMAPEWFIRGLNQLKEEIKEEVTANISSVIANAVAELKTPFLNYPVCSHSLKLKGKMDMRVRKHTHHTSENIPDAKDLMKALKLESKMEKMERIAEKRGHKSRYHGLKSSDSEAGHSSSRSRSRGKEERRKLEEQQRRQVEEQPVIRVEPIMDARPISLQTSVPHMLGGEVYLHQWEVQNTGQAPWTSMTQLRYSYGHKQLMPVEKLIMVPYLKPGEVGTISVSLQVPTRPGQYECHWQFLHKGYRFGHGLGVQVIVDPFDLKGHSSVLEKTGPFELGSTRTNDVEEQEKLVALHSSDAQTPRKCLTSGQSAEALASFYKSLQSDKQAGSKRSCDSERHTEKPREVSDHLSEMHFERRASMDAKLYPKLDWLDVDEFDSDCSWKSEPTRFWSKVDEQGEFVVVPVPQCFVLDTPESDYGVQVKDKTPSPKEEKKTEPSAGPSIAQSAADKNFDDNNNTESISGRSSGSIKLRDEELDNIVFITVPKDDQVKDGFIYVHVDGQKVLIPKNILKSEVISAAQELERIPSAASSIGVIFDSNEALNKTPTPSVTSTVTESNAALPEPKINDQPSEGILNSAPPKTLEEPVLPKQAPSNEAVDLTAASKGSLEHSMKAGDANNYPSHCSAAGSCFSEVNCRSNIPDRLFVFPEDVAGYEVTTGVGGDQATFNPSPLHPLANPFVEAVPNYQQTPPEMRRAPVDPDQSRNQIADDEQLQRQMQEEEFHSAGVVENQEAEPSAPHQVHILPETLVNGAVNVASSAINTARSVINMIRPQTPGRWVNGHWVSTGAETPRETNLQALAEMGFWNRDLNATLLARFNDDLNRVVAELVQ